jgi:hypothetical protein
MARRNTPPFVASFSVDGKQFVHARHDRSGNNVPGIQLHRFKKQPPRMCPARGVYHSRPADLIGGPITVGLQNAFELSQEMRRPIASTPQAEVEYYASSGSAVLPQIGLMVPSSSPSPD